MADMASLRFTTTAGWLTNAEVVTDERGRAQTFPMSDTEPGTATPRARRRQRWKWRSSTRGCG